MSSDDHKIMMHLKLGRWSDQRPLRNYELEREWLERKKGSDYKIAKPTRKRLPFWRRFGRQRPDLAAS
ncbi:hypothetical protein M3P21_02190 [Ruegeria sp. 2012CJ41-6]|uniref:Uncharacterized protein n=1 Tax=Ruegeria spongiae TaxID=2942209 RepID=A0ABT0PXI5_9RHOB|nr:hypothetical protein [Ruegeria spongiae]MCL6282325.1 hypothetical protein [Ruegeria spongiae]